MQRLPTATVIGAGMVAAALWISGVTTDAGSAGAATLSLAAACWLGLRLRLASG
jgi:hypothetical protein